MSQTPSTEISLLRDCEAKPEHPECESWLRKALLSSNNRTVARAARLIGDQKRKSLADELRQAYDGFLAEEGKLDPGCLAKTALAEVLRQYEYPDSEFFLTGIRYRQYEPVYGGSSDSAAELRAICGFALIQQSHSQAMSELVELLTDPEKTSRAGAARAIAHGGGEASEWLLRLKISCGDPSPEVMGECFLGLLRLNPNEGIPRIAKYLNHSNKDLACEAALALGETRIPAAFPPLQQQLNRTQDGELERALLMAMGMLSLPESVEFLLAMVNEGNYARATAAIQALAHSRDSASVKSRLTKLVNEPANARLQRELKDAFGE
ncbi:HEAT repeat domain-containing protein [Bythopirellula goksoeyrii]|uniref:HEAT repeat protein n=1 Tax=Bythopirellula goksoeyrii TaxID=1400387 RepID=A0A5B9Q1W9_9BACT|nr:HEAT repeat domain-containing protein [Bythopirellula goksoeyrii]QEG33037.1 hypothetical protein Pr1d_02980 [Bythopirellula goksoeyrii]